MELRVPVCPPDGVMEVFPGREMLGDHRGRSGAEC